MPGNYQSAPRPLDDVLKLLDMDYPPVRITEKSRQECMREAMQGSYRMPVRMAMGKFYTDEEWQRRRAEILAKPLP
jgi:hypothetical protein